MVSKQCFQGKRWAYCDGKRFVSLLYVICDVGFSMFVFFFYLSSSEEEYSDACGLFLLLFFFFFFVQVLTL